MPTAHLLLLRGAMGAGKTTTAALLKDRAPNLEIIEVDALKLLKYGRVETCDPAVDFPEAGLLAKQAMQSGKIAVVVEPLCERRHLHYVLSGAGLSQHSPAVSSVWLDCTLPTALSRKGAHFPSSSIESQFSRYPHRFRPLGELVLPTDSLSPDSVASAVLRHLHHCGEKG